MGSLYISHPLVEPPSFKEEVYISCHISLFVYKRQVYVCLLSMWTINKNPGINLLLFITVTFRGNLCLHISLQGNPKLHLYLICCFCQRGLICHETKKGCNYKVYEIIPCINSSHPKQDGEEYIKKTCPAYLYYRGMGILSTKDLIISLLSSISYSSLKITLCGIVYSERVLMSSGITKSLP